MLGVDGVGTDQTGSPCSAPRELMLHISQWQKRKPGKINLYCYVTIVHTGINFKFLTGNFQLHVHTCTLSTEFY